jgi:hypothetical protein
MPLWSSIMSLGSCSQTAVCGSLEVHESRIDRSVLCGSVLFFGKFTIIRWIRKYCENVIYVRETIVAVTKVHASRPRKDFIISPPHRAAISQQYSVASFVMLRVLSCLHSPGLRCSCDLEVWNFVTATIAGLHTDKETFLIKWSVSVPNIH